MILKSTIKNQLLLLRMPLYMIALLLLIMIGYNFNQISLFTAIFITCFWLPPYFFLYAEYLIYNMNKKYEIRPEKIIIHQHNNTQVYTSSQFASIKIYMLPKFNFLKMDRPLDKFKFVRIMTKSNEKIILTSLLTPNLEKAINILENVKIERKEVFYCSIVFCK